MSTVKFVGGAEATIMNEGWLEGSGRGGSGQAAATEGGGSGSYGGFPGGPSPYGIFAVPQRLRRLLSALSASAQQEVTVSRAGHVRRGSAGAALLSAGGQLRVSSNALLCARVCIVGADSF